MEIALPAILFAALALDSILGEPPVRIHPVCWTGTLAVKIEKMLRHGPNSTAMFLRGLASCLLIIAIMLLGLSMSMALAESIFGAWGGYLVALLCVYICMAPNCLAQNARSVALLLEKQDLPEARKAVGTIVGRKTDNLDQYAVARACIESVAENLTDSTLATLFWATVGLCFGGYTGCAMLVLLHRIANILDAMWGKKNDIYIRFGTAAAVLDDLLNYIPARLSLPCIVLATAICSCFVEGFNAKASWQMGWKYRRAHASPNSAWSEAPFAGALGLQFGGVAEYTKLQVNHPLIGEGSPQATSEHIQRAIQLLFCTTLLFTVLATACSCL